MIVYGIPSNTHAFSIRSHPAEIGTFSSHIAYYANMMLYRTSMSGTHNIDLPPTELEHNLRRHDTRRKKDTWSRRDFDHLRWRVAFRVYLQEISIHTYMPLNMHCILRRTIYRGLPSNYHQLWAHWRVNQMRRSFRFMGSLMYHWLIEWQSFTYPLFVNDISILSIAYMMEWMPSSRWKGCIYHLIVRSGTCIV